MVIITVRNKPIKSKNAELGSPRHSRLRRLQLGRAQSDDECKQTDAAHGRVMNLPFRNRSPEHGVETEALVLSASQAN